MACCSPSPPDWPRAPPTGATGSRSLPGHRLGLARRWSLHLGPPFEPGGESAWVAPAGDGLVLKVGWVHDEARDEAAGLRAWAGQGAVRLLAEPPRAPTSALLLERAMPGTPLTALPGPEQDVVLAGLLRRLWIEPPAPSTRSARCRRCATPGSRRSGPQLAHLEPGLVRDGLALFRALPRDDVPPRLLPTDLHAENVLERASRAVAHDRPEAVRR